MPPSKRAAEQQEQPPDHGHLLVMMAGIGISRPFLGRDADRRVVEAQRQLIALDAAGRQPIARIGARRNDDHEAAVAVAHDLLAGEIVALQRIGDQLAVEIIERQGPEARGRRHARRRPRRSARRAAGHCRLSWR